MAFAGIPPPAAFSCPCGSIQPHFLANALTFSLLGKQLLLTAPCYLNAAVGIPADSLGPPCAQRLSPTCFSCGKHLWVCGTRVHVYTDFGRHLSSQSTLLAKAGFSLSLELNHWPMQPVSRSWGTCVPAHSRGTAGRYHNCLYVECGNPGGLISAVELSPPSPQAPLSLFPVATGNKTQESWPQMQWQAGTRPLLGMGDC